MRKLLLENDMHKLSHSSKSSKQGNKKTLPKRMRSLTKIPFSDEKANSIKKDIDTIKLFSQEINESEQKSIERKNLKREETKSRIFKVKEKIDNILDLKTKVNKKKINELYRNGVSKNEISSFFNENSKLYYPQIIQKTPLKNFMNVRRVEDNAFENHFKKVVEIRKENNKKNIENLTREIIVKCKNPLYITNPLKFREGNRFVDNYINIDKDIEIEKLINNMIEKKFKLKKEVIETVNKRQQDMIESKRKKLFTKLRRTIIKCALHFKKTNMTLIDFYKLKINTVLLLDSKKWELLIRAIKEDKMFLASEILSQNRVLVYKEDKFSQTALHIIAKRNRFHFINLFLISGAQINARDSLGRTPLHIAAKYNSIESSKILLFELADPFIITNEGKTANLLTKSTEIVYCLKHAKALHTLYQLDSLKSAEKIRKGLEYMFSYEEMKNLNLNKENHDNTK